MSISSIQSHQRNAEPPTARVPHRSAAWKLPAAALGLEALAAWQLADSGAFPAAEGSDGDLRATAQALLGLGRTSYLELLGIS